MQLGYSAGPAVPMSHPPCPVSRQLRGSDASHQQRMPSKSVVAACCTFPVLLLARERSRSLEVRTHADDTRAHAQMLTQVPLRSLAAGATCLPVI